MLFGFNCFVCKINYTTFTGLKAKHTIHPQS